MGALWAHELLAKVASGLILVSCSQELAFAYAGPAKLPPEKLPPACLPLLPPPPWLPLDKSCTIRPAARICAMLDPWCPCWPASTEVVKQWRMNPRRTMYQKFFMMDICKKVKLNQLRQNTYHKNYFYSLVLPIAKRTNKNWINCALKRKFR